MQICFGWGVGISRIIDNKHSTADVVGGFVLGAMFGLVFVLKVSTHICILSKVNVHAAWQLARPPAHCLLDLKLAPYLPCAGHPDRKVCRGTR